MRWLGLVVMAFAAGCLGTSNNPLYDGGPGGSTGGGADATAGTTGPDGGPGTPDSGTTGGPDAGTTGGPDAGDACTPRAWYPDEDGDELGAGATVHSCTRPDGGYVADGGDPEPGCSTNDSECAVGELRCSGGSAREVCTVEDGCRRFTSFFSCVLGGLSACTGAGDCVECVDSDDCTDDDASVCTDDHECVQCVSKRDCEDPTPACSDQHECVECLINDDCPGDDQVCTRGHECVDCLDAEDCSEEAPFCRFNECVECLTEDHCPEERSFCSGNACVNCESDANCPASAPVCDESGECLGCDASATACDRFPAAPVCDPASGRCVECVTGAAQLCVGDTPVCANDAPECVECNLNSECDAYDEARCVDHQCVECEDGGGGASGCADVEREGRPAEVCIDQPGGNECVECDTDEDCDAEPGDITGGDELCTPNHWCVDGGEGSAGEDCGACYDSRQCPEGSLCIVVEGQEGALTPQGECLPEQNGAGVCTTRGYLIEVEAVDVIGEVVAACRPRLASCEEMLRYLDSCEGQEAETLCTFDGLDPVWTVSCGVHNDCPSEVICAGGYCSF